MSHQNLLKFISPSIYASIMFVFSSVGASANPIYTTLADSYGPCAKTLYSNEIGIKENSLWNVFDLKSKKVVDVARSRKSLCVLRDRFGGQVLHSEFTSSKSLNGSFLLLKPLVVRTQDVRINKVQFNQLPADLKQVIRSSIISKNDSKHFKPAYSDSEQYTIDLDGDGQPDVVRLSLSFVNMPLSIDAIFVKNDTLWTLRYSKYNEGE